MAHARVMLTHSHEGWPEGSIITSDATFVGGLVDSGTARYLTDEERADLELWDAELRRRRRERGDPERIGDCTSIWTPAVEVE